MISVSGSKGDLPSGVTDLGERIAGLLARSVINVDEWREGDIRHRNVRPLILSLEAPNVRNLRLQVRMDKKESLRPEENLALLGVLPADALITRQRIVVAP